MNAAARSSNAGGARRRETNVNNISDAAQYSAPLTIWTQKGNSDGTPFRKVESDLLHEKTFPVCAKAVRKGPAPAQENNDECCRCDDPQCDHD
jgi:hypothetical protein